MMSSNTMYRQRIKSNNHNQPADILFELLSDDEFQYTIRARFIMLVQIEFSFYFDLNFSLKFGCLCNALREGPGLKVKHKYFMQHNSKFQIIVYIIWSHTAKVKIF